jgi:hypothetical protein
MIRLRRGKPGAKRWRSKDGQWAMGNGSSARRRSRFLLSFWKFLPKDALETNWFVGHLGGDDEFGELDFEVAEGVGVGGAIGFEAF